MGLMPSDWRGFESLRMYKKMLETIYKSSLFFVYLPPDLMIGLTTDAI